MDAWTIGPVALLHEFGLRENDVAPLSSAEREHQLAPFRRVQRLVEQRVAKALKRPLPMNLPTGGDN